MYGTGGRGRTDTPVKERDFESRASANSATPAKQLKGSNLLILKWCRGPDLNRHGSHLPQDFKSCVSANSTTPAGLIACTFNYKNMEAAPGFEPGVKVLQTRALPLGYAAEYLERKTRFELATPTLARWCSTTELLPHINGWASRIRTCA